jgi:hypothetical protein
LEEEQQKSGAIRIAQHYIRLGDKEQAIRWLTLALDKPTFIVPYISVDPIYDQIRYDPRFVRLVTKVGL